MGLGLRPGAKAPDQPPMPYRLRASPRLYLARGPQHSPQRVSSPPTSSRPTREPRAESTAMTIATTTRITILKRTFVEADGDT